MKLAFQATVLGKHQVTYYHCESCGLLQTEKPYWLDEAYAEAISDLDTGLVRRNLKNRKLVEPILHLLFGNNVKVLDVGGGYGLFARLLRDIGYECYSLDKHCKNLFARPFEPDAGFTADVLVAFEVMEHIEDASSLLRQGVTDYLANTIIFSTVTYANGIPPKNWWYYSFESGQHVSFYQEKTLVVLAKQFGLTYVGMANNIHIMTGRKIGYLPRLILTNKRMLALYGRYVRLRRLGLSRVWDDYLMVRDRLRSGGGGTS